MKAKEIWLPILFLNITMKTEMNNIEIKLEKTNGVRRHKKGDARTFLYPNYFSFEESPFRELKKLKKKKDSK